MSFLDYQQYQPSIEETVAGTLREIGIGNIPSASFQDEQINNFTKNSTFIPNAIPADNMNSQLEIDTNDQVTAFYTKIRRRKSNPSQWKRNVQKDNRDRCMPYENRQGVLKDAKLPKDVDCSACKFKCALNFTTEDRINICNIYWGLRSYERRKDFILSIVETDVPKTRRMRKIGGKERTNAKTYYLYKNESKYRVCQNFFRKTLNISNTSINNAFKFRSKDGTYEGIDKRGRKSPINKTSFNDIIYVKTHIEKFTKTILLNQSPSVEKMYDQYTVHCYAENKNPVSLHMYRKFLSDLGITSKPSKKERKLNTLNLTSETPH